MRCWSGSQQPAWRPWPFARPLWRCFAVFSPGRFLANWSSITMRPSRATAISTSWPMLVIVVMALVRYANAGMARHLAYLLALAWLGWFYIELPELWVASLLFGAGLVAFLLASLPLSPFYRLARDAGAAPAFYSFALTVMGLAALHTEVEGLGQDIAIGATTLAVGARWHRYCRTAERPGAFSRLHGFCRRNPLFGLRDARQHPWHIRFLPGRRPRRGIDCLAGHPAGETPVW